MVGCRAGGLLNETSLYTRAILCIAGEILVCDQSEKGAEVVWKGFEWGGVR
jgi:hypothetical protein